MGRNMKIRIARLATALTGALVYSYYSEGIGTAIVCCILLFPMDLFEGKKDCKCKTE